MRSSSASRARPRCATWPTTYPYEAHEDDDVGLRSDPGQIANALRKEIQARLDKAGVEVIEARISHLAYAPRDCQRYAAPTAGFRGHCRPQADRSRRRGHGGDGVIPS